MYKLSYREKFSAFVLFSIGIIYLFLYIISFFQNESSVISSTENQLSFNKTAISEQLRTWIILFFTIAGSVLLFRKKKTGWIFSLAIFPVFLVMLGGGLFTSISMDMTEGPTFWILISGGLILLLAFIFLLLPSCIKKFNIQILHVIITVILAVSVAYIFFLS